MPPCNEAVEWLVARWGQECLKKVLRMTSLPWLHVLVDRLYYSWKLQQQPEVWDGLERIAFDIMIEAASKHCAKLAAALTSIAHSRYNNDSAHSHIYVSEVKHAKLLLDYVVSSAEESLKAVDSHKRPPHEWSRALADTIKKDGRLSGVLPRAWPGTLSTSRVHTGAPTAATPTSGLIAVVNRGRPGSISSSITPCARGSTSTLSPV